MKNHISYIKEEGKEVRTYTPGLDFTRRLTAEQREAAENKLNKLFHDLFRGRILVPFTVGAYFNLDSAKDDAGKIPSVAYAIGASAGYIDLAIEELIASLREEIPLNTVIILNRHNPVIMEEQGPWEVQLDEDKVCEYRYLAYVRFAAIYVRS